LRTVVVVVVVAVVVVAFCLVFVSGCRTQNGELRTGSDLRRSEDPKMGRGLAETQNGQFLIRDTIENPSDLYPLPN